MKVAQKPNSFRTSLFLKACLSIISLFLWFSLVACSDVQNETAHAPKLADIEKEVEDAIHIAYASAYWEAATTLSYAIEAEPREMFWQLADEELSLLSTSNDNLAEVRRILAFERSNLGDIMGWFEFERHGFWLLTPGYDGPIDVLNPHYIESSRRTCRIVAAIIIERSVVLLKALEEQPNSENYWNLVVAGNAIGDALNACPEPGWSEEPLLLSIARVSFDLRTVTSSHREDFFPQLDAPENEFTRYLIESGDFRMATKVKPPITSIELEQLSISISDRAITLWQDGPDNILLKSWNWMLKLKERFA